MSSSSTPKKNEDKGSKSTTPSPGSKISRDYDYWNVSGPSKKLKLEEPGPKEATCDTVKMKDLMDLSAQIHKDKSLSFRVSMRKTFITENKGKDQKTIKFHGLDGTGEVAFVAFDSEARRFDEIIQMDACLRLTGFELMEEHPSYPNHTGIKLGVKLMKDSDMDLLETDIPELNLDFKKLDELDGTDKGQLIDVLGIVVANWGIEDTGRKMRRYLSIVDETGHSRVTLWRQDAVEFGDDIKIPIALRKVEVEEYRGKKSLNTLYFSTIWKNPAVDFHSLVEWFEEKDKEREAALQKQDLEADGE